MRSWLVWMLAAAVAIPLSGCGKGAGKRVKIAGSTSVQPFAELLKEPFEKAHRDIEVLVDAGGSTVGLRSLDTGLADIGACSRELTADERATGKYTEVTIARDGLAIVVNKSNPVGDLTLEQVRKLFSGQATNWKDVGGSDAPVFVIVREEASGTREAFMHLVMGSSRVLPKALVTESNGTVKEVIKSNPNAIGYLSLGLVGTEVKAVSIGGVSANHQNVLNGRYALVRPFLFVVRADKPVSAEAQAFIDFVVSAEGQAVLEKEGLVRIK